MTWGPHEASADSYNFAPGTHFYEDDSAAASKRFSRSESQLADGSKLVPKL